MTVKLFTKWTPENFSDQLAETPSAPELAKRISALISAAEKAVGNSEKLMNMIRSRIKRLQELPLAVQFVIVELFQKIIDGIRWPSEISSVAASMATSIANANNKTSQSFPKWDSASNDEQFRLSA